MRRRRTLVVSMMLVGGLAGSSAFADWQPHDVRLVNGTSTIVVPAQIQIVSEAWNRVVAVPYIVYMPEKDRVLMLVGCDYPHHAEMLFSDDHGAAWSDPKPVLLDKAGKVIDGLGTSLTYLGEGRVLFLTGDRRWLSNDYGQTRGPLSAIETTMDGKPWYTWDPLWVDRDKEGQVSRLIETGYTWQRKPEVEKDHQQGYLRFSTDLGKTWTPSVKVPQWKEVSEVALLRAANGDLVAACRTDIPPSKAGEWIDHYEGLGISISKDRGQTWSPVTKLYDYGRHHPSLALLPDRRMVMTYVVRKGYVDTEDGLPQFGIEAVLSSDNGQTWDLDHKYILHAWEGNRTGENKWWASSQATSTVLLPDGSLLTAFGTGYRTQPGPEGGNPAPRDAGLVLWRLSDVPLDDTYTVTAAPADSDTRNIFNPTLRVEPENSEIPLSGQGASVCFVLENEGRLYLDWGAEAFRLYEPFVSQHPSLAPAPQDAPLSNVIPHDAAKWILRQMNISFGIPYRVYLLQRGKAFQGVLVDAAYRPSGDGGFKGFVGVIESPDDIMESNDATGWYVPVGIAVSGKPVAEPRKASQKPLRTLLTDSVISETLARVLTKRFVRYEFKGQVGLDPQQEADLVMAFAGDGEGYLFCIARSGSKARVVPFSKKWPALDGYGTAIRCEGGGLVVEDPNAHYDLGMRDSRAYVVAGFDQSSSDLVVVVSTVSAVYKPRLVKQAGEISALYELAPCVSCYFGP